MKENLRRNCILILDFGSQYTQLIARRIREIGVYCEIHPYYIPNDLILRINPAAVVLSGGPKSTTNSNAPYIKQVIFDLNVPILGICYGMQVMTKQLGGKIDNTKSHEFGYAKIKIRKSLLFDGLESISFIDVWMSHSDSIDSIPNGFAAIASTTQTPYAAIENTSSMFYGLQFHPEVTQTSYGKEILKNFVVKIASCETTWTTKSIVDDTKKSIKEKVKEQGVVLALSGGVDSSVCAALISKAIGKKLHCLFIDTGLLRLNEGNYLMSVFQTQLGINVTRVNAQNRFLKALKGITDPEKKRRVIGSLFIDIFEEESKKLGKYTWLAQGTIYPDIIESAKLDLLGNVSAIKSHHNVGGLPKKMPFKLVEPLRELFKDEVRKVGVALGLPKDMVYRHPFPGPGLALRILGSVNKYYLDILRSADYIFIQELRAHGYYELVSQAFAVFLPVKSVGVKGDCRCYDYVIALRAVETIDFMTAKFSALSSSFFSKVSRRIINEVPCISRVVLDMSEKPPATIEWE